MTPHVKRRKIAIVGSRAVGKSSLACRFVDGVFVDSYYPTIENSFSKTVCLNGQDYDTEILDTAGQDEFSILNSKHFIGIHGYLLVFAVTNALSFETALVIRKRILHQLGTTSCPIVLVGNKSDACERQREVTKKEGEEKAKELEIPFFETSAREGINVARAFETLIEEIENAYRPVDPPKSRCVVM